MTNRTNNVLYAGVTSNLYNRVWEHKNKYYPESFTSRDNAIKLVFFELYIDIGEAIAREKKIKGGSREKKLELINHRNPLWKDLSGELTPG